MVVFLLACILLVLLLGSRGFLRLVTGVLGIVILIVIIALDSPHDDTKAKEPQAAPIHTEGTVSTEQASAPVAATGKHSAPRALAGCLLRSANAFQVPTAVLIGIMGVEGAHVGAETKSAEDGAAMLGPMHISSRILPQLAQQWNVDIDTARKRVRDNACVNVQVAASILHEKILSTGSLYNGIASYHADIAASAPNVEYADTVIKAMESKGLIKHDALPFDTPPTRDNEISASPALTATERSRIDDRNIIDDLIFCLGEKAGQVNYSTSDGGRSSAEKLLQSKCSTESAVWLSRCMSKGGTTEICDKVALDNALKFVFFTEKMKTFDTLRNVRAAAKTE